jgi:hypothetical protein
VFSLTVVVAALGMLGAARLGARSGARSAAIAGVD